MPRYVHDVIDSDLGVSDPSDASTISRPGRRRDAPVHDRRSHHGLRPRFDLDNEGLRSVLERALGRLPEAHREAFLLKHVRGFSYEEMTENMDASVTALRMRVLRAREVLRSIVREVRAPTQGRSDTLSTFFVLNAEAPD